MNSQKVQHRVIARSVAKLSIYKIRDCFAPLATTAFAAFYETIKI